jgi:hypothetical protein
VSANSRVTAKRDVALVELLDRALGAGVVLTGDITLSLADIDLVYVNLRALIGSVSTVRPGGTDGDLHTLSASGADEL